MIISVYVASNRPYNFPDDPVYHPIHVGKIFSNEHFCELSDNTGDNISEKNKTYCELTALYWFWKNDISSDYMGLCHYRRYFASKRIGKKAKRVITGKQIEEYFTKNPNVIIVPKKRNYLFDTLYSHYTNTHDGTHLDIARSVIAQLFPEFLSSFDKTMKQHKAYMFNMFIMRRETVNEYCKWLFAVLPEIEKKIDVTFMSAFDARVFGRISELLWNVWLNQYNYSIKETRYVNLSKINWLGKIRAYFSAKFFGKKLDRSY